jgi:hypothetical protein
MNRAMYARAKAKGLLGTPVEKVPEPKVVDKKITDKKKLDLGKIAMKDLTGKLEKKFDNIEQAVAEGFNLPNIVGAIKGKKKYKGHLWTAEKKVN